jgi:hypothetical protein
MLCIDVEEAHHRELPELVRDVARGIDDLDPRVRSDPRLARPVMG